MSICLCPHVEHVHFWTLGPYVYYTSEYGVIYICVTHPICIWICICRCGCRLIGVCRCRCRCTCPCICVCACICICICICTRLCLYLCMCMCYCMCGCMRPVLVTFVCVCPIPISNRGFYIAHRQWGPLSSFQPKEPDKICVFFMLGLRGL